MRGRPFEVPWREEDTEESLKAAYHVERQSALRTRLHALWLLRSGWRLDSVATALGVHYRSVQRWVGWYRQGGMPAVLSHKMGGKGQEPFLSDEQQAQVGEEVASGRFRTAGEVRDWLIQQYGTSYTLGGVYSLLKRLHCAPKVPRPLHTNAQPKQQEAWKKGG
jgi:transposase